MSSPAAKEFSPSGTKQMTSPEPSTVRPARLVDAAAIARIYNQGIEERQATFETEPRSAEDIAALLAERGDQYPTIVVERNGTVIAWSGAGPYSDRPCRPRHDMPALPHI
jgi:phosphinothricin acetyltransferase